LRINPDGLLDSTFGENGLVSKNFGKPPKINAIQLQPDGKILVGGGMSGDFFLTRYNANGTIDENFGNEGYVLTSFSQGVAAMNSIAIEPNGKILAAGVTQFESAFAQYTMDGSLDEKNTTTFNVASSYVNSIAIEDDGSFVVTGLAGKLFEGGTVVAKFKSIGVVDSSFGTNGNVFVHFGTANSVYLQDNKIIVAGTGSDTDTPKFMVFRLQLNGMFDSSFGTNGIAFANFGDGYIPVDFKGFPDNTGKIILTGNASGDLYNGHTILLARFNNDESRKQILITKIRKWIQHHNGIEWDYNKNISNYIVQRSYDGIHFSSITRITASNHSNYTYADPAPLPGNNYYRLQATSLNGTVNYSNILAVANSDIKISPNPATNSLHIEGLSNQKVQLSVVDFSGSIKLQTMVNSSTYTLNIASLKPGNYLLKIKSQGYVISKGFVKE